MLHSGPEMDAITGEPRIERASLQRMDAERRRQSALDRYHRLRNELAGGEGSVLREILAGLMTTRIDALMQQDPECQGYLHLLTTLGVQLATGRKVAESLVGAVFDEAP